MIMTMITIKPYQNRDYMVSVVEVEWIVAEEATEVLEIGHTEDVEKIASAVLAEQEMATRIDLQVDQTIVEVNVEVVVVVVKAEALDLEADLIAIVVASEVLETLKRTMTKKANLKIRTKLTFLLNQSMIKRLTKKQSKSK